MLLQPNLLAQSPLGKSETTPAISLRQPPAPPSRVAELIQQLGDRSYRQRMQARWELERIGLEAFDQLRNALTHENPEIERAARYLLQSQDVIWWRDTDSVEVRGLLQNYDSLSTSEKRTTFEQLAQLQSPDAFLALARLTRFERDDSLSRFAALALMNRATEARNDSAIAKLLETPLLNSLVATLGKSDRAAVSWLRGLTDDLALPARPASESVAAWKELAELEHQGAAELVPDTGTPISIPATRGLSKEKRAVLTATLEFYRWLGAWITPIGGREAAIDVVRPCLDLVEHEPRSLSAAADWMIEGELYELLPELAAGAKELFRDNALLSYTLAQSHLLLGQGAQAAQIATQARQATHDKILAARIVSNRYSLEELEGSQRSQIAQQLEWRGLYDWAEQEYLLSLKLLDDLQKEYSIRERLAYMYWTGEQNRQAADTLKPVAEAIVSEQVSRDPLLAFDPQTLLSNYYFYSGLAEIDSGNVAAATEMLVKAHQLPLATPNPDIVIAMRSLRDSEPGATYYHDSLESMAERFRIMVVESEGKLLNVDGRDQRRSARKMVAENCNQLAWLLGCCGVDLQEAIKLSRRSLELSPDTAAYLDTLARCLYANGDLQEAVKIQRRAVELAPHERQLKSQLVQFEAEFAKRASE